MTFLLELSLFLQYLGIKLATKLLESGFIPFPNSFQNPINLLILLYRLWLALSEKGKLLFSWFSYKANKKVAKLVVLNTKSKKVITDKTPWYRSASRELGREWEHETFGRRGVVERTFMTIKKRMKGFLKSFQPIANMKQ